MGLTIQDLHTDLSQRNLNSVCIDYLELLNLPPFAAFKYVSKMNSTVFIWKWKTNICEHTVHVLIEQPHNEMFLKKRSDLY